MYARRIAALLLTAAAVAAPSVIAPSAATADGAGGHSGDFTVDRESDLLARVAADGRLVIYPRTPGVDTEFFGAPVTINHGWGGMRWIGAADINGTGAPYYYQHDVVSVDHAGVMRVALHRGTFDGTRTLDPQVVVGTGWQINDLIHPVAYYNSTSRASLLARRKGTGDVYLYENTGYLDQRLFMPPVRMFTGRQNDVWEAVNRITNSDAMELMFVDTAGRLGVFDSATGRTHWLGTGWQTVDSITLVTPPGGNEGIIARRRSDGALLYYARTTHSWEPAPDGSAYHLYAAPKVIGHNWYVNDLIT